MTRITNTFAATAKDIEQRRCELIAHWETGWEQMIGQWSSSGDDAMWLMFSASYLMRTSNVHWALDPVTLGKFFKDANPVNIDVLSNLSFVLMTHSHSDHVDSSLLAKLSDKSIRWVVPEHMSDIILKNGVPVQRIVVPEPMKPIELQGLRITSFPGLHWEYERNWNVGKPKNGVDATGYLIEWDNQSLLIPGDTRTYDVSALPHFKNIQTLLIHVWLGRGAAGIPHPPLLDAFCDFITSLQPKQRVILSHLREVNRNPGDYWDERHAELISQCLSDRLEDVSIETPNFWEKQTL